MKKSRVISYIITTFLSLTYLFFGNMYASGGLELFSGEDMFSTKVKITKVLKVTEITPEYFDQTGIEVKPDTKITFEGTVLRGENKGQTLKATQLIDGYKNGIVSPVKKGDTVFLYYSNEGEYDGSWLFAEYDRFGKIILLACLFFAAMLIFGRLQGFNTIISLLLTCAAVFLVFIPAVLTGKNVYFWSIATCIFIILMTLILIYGINKKSFAASLGCFSGVLIAGLLTIIMDRILRLSGYVNENGYYLMDMGIDLKGIMFGAVIIGAMGAIMDIAISLSSSLLEVHEKAESITASDIIHSGFSIGRDILGTMSNTLILAYIGSSLSVILVLAVYSSCVLELLNREQIIVEILQSLIGIIAILCTIPFTSFICGFFYGGKNEDKYLIVHKDKFMED